MKILFAAASTLALALASAPVAHAQKGASARSVSTGTVTPGQTRVTGYGGRGWYAAVKRLTTPCVRDTTLRRCHRH